MKLDVPARVSTRLQRAPCCVSRSEPWEEKSRWSSWGLGDVGLGPDIVICR